jgi:hypothetical protein
MARINKKAGDILEFPLSEPSKFGYCQWLTDGTARFFLVACNSSPQIEKLLSHPVAFRVVVYKDTPGRYGWSKIGNAPVPENYNSPQHYAKKDIISGELSIYFEGKESPATLKEISGLETLAVWAHPHIVERLEAQLENRNSAFLKSISIAT